MEFKIYICYVNFIHFNLAICYSNPPLPLWKTHLKNK